ncbi:DUF3060 domain-containing protein [Vitiosangium sp. GDMCC 1.1324]|uniref:DUF3060 domain-containing protein n=1 Tax=Vitiosangium sp. (strain GDMCC 1.1324) TaxID=2138576 RepID=UPI000D3B321C|nr:DUF3060 domain-containing protein [Vitiosangium sp. GDMCC 1.1324]PTL83452.1 hypothetical protein DAT35_15900 [Vitiosangium sp. GDMCC 1.1324]
MSKFIRGTVLSGVLASLLLAPAMGAAQGHHTYVKVGKNGHVDVKAGKSAVKVDGTGVDAQTDEAEVEARSDEGSSAQDEETPAGTSLEISDSGAKETHRCSPKTDVNISGSDNEIILTGECKSVSVSGSTNKVKVEATGTISVEGADNEVTWKRAVGGKKPKVNRVGTNNKVTQAR